MWTIAISQLSRTSQDGPVWGLHRSSSRTRNPSWLRPTYPYATLEQPLDSSPGFQSVPNRESSRVYPRLGKQTLTSYLLCRTTPAVPQADFL